MKDCDMYETVCKDRFDKLEELHNETIGLIRGKNGTPGLVEEIHIMKRQSRAIIATGIFLGGAVMTQIIESLWKWLVK